jgi:hypothetical protein
MNMITNKGNTRRLIFPTAVVSAVDPLLESDVIVLPIAVSVSPSRGFLSCLIVQLMRYYISVLVREGETG